jgi:hypothetical protein
MNNHFNRLLFEVAMCASLSTRSDGSVLLLNDEWFRAQRPASAAIIFSLRQAA